MDNLAHSLVGLTTAKAGLERLSPFATTVSILAANSPDVDVFIGLFSDRWTLLKHHRGITHSIVGTLALGILVPLIFYLAERAISHFRKRPPKIRLRGLLIASLIATATHPIMDWTNNYGVRPLLPWSGRWFYGDLTFVVDPYLWLIIGGAAFLLTSNHRLKVAGWSLLAGGIFLVTFTQVAQRFAGGISLWPLRLTWLSGVVVLIAARRLKIDERFGRKVAIAALSFVIVYWGGLAAAHHFALQSAAKNAGLIVSPLNETVVKTAAMPTLGSARRWLCIVETDKAVYRFSIKLGSSSPFDRIRRVDDPYRMANTPGVQRFPKPAGSTAKLVDIAAQDRRAQIFLAFARFPVAEVDDENCLKQTLVQFADVRYTEPGSGRGNFSVDIPIDCPAR
jgi:inner membrane protein